MKRPRVVHALWRAVRTSWVNTRLGLRRIARWWIFALPSLLAVSLLWLSPLRDWEAGPGLRALYAWRGTRPPPADVLIVSIDFASARALHLPERVSRWPRDLHAQLIDALTASQARVISFDVLFMEAMDGLSDARLAQAIERSKRVMLVEAITRDPIYDEHGQVQAWIDRRVQPLPVLRDAAWATGPFILPKTPQGVTAFWSHLTSLGNAPTLPWLIADALRHTAPGVNTDHHILNLYGPLGTVKTLSFHDALRIAQDPVAGPQTFGGKAVLVGFSEANQSRQADAYPTPYTREDGVDISGVELGATAVGNLLDGSALHRLSALQEWVALILWVFGLSLPWTTLPLARAAATSLGLVLAGTWGIGQTFAWAHGWLPVVLPLGIAPWVTAGVGITQQLWRTRRRQAALEDALTQGVSRAGLERMLAALGQHNATGQTVHAVCLFSDIEGYTSLSENRPPAQMRECLNSYYQLTLPVLEAYGGHVADTVGDAIMTMWLANDDPQTACRQAVDAARALHRRLNVAPEQGALPTRFGLHLGPVFLGPVGTPQHSDIRAVGDLINTCSRIQGLNKQLGTRVLISDALVQTLPDLAQRPVGTFVLTGKTQALALAELLNGSDTHAMTHSLSGAAFLAGLDAYARGCLRTAHAWFLHCEREHRRGNDPVARFYIGLCERLDPLCRRPPPGALALPPTDEPARPNWDGHVHILDK